tara:strand:- start:986 stop:1147 length:162 start_codon:yes stop_codon:yes gene_type:complete
MKAVYKTVGIKELNSTKAFKPENLNTNNYKDKTAPTLQKVKGEFLYFKFLKLK